MQNTRKEGIRTTKTGAKMAILYVDIPVEMAKKLQEIAEKKGNSKKFLVCKALKMLFLSEEEK